MVTGINSGGPVLLVYGIIVVMLVSICVGVSLSELASALPNAGKLTSLGHPLTSSLSTRLAVKMHDAFRDQSSVQWERLKQSFSDTNQ